MATRLSVERSADCRLPGCNRIRYVFAEAFLADTKHPQFDCLVLDVYLGGMSGIELGQRLVAEGHSTPFICLTGQNRACFAAGDRVQMTVPDPSY